MRIETELKLDYAPSSFKKNKFYEKCVVLCLCDLKVSPPPPPPPPSPPPPPPAPAPPPQGQDNIYDDPYQPEMDQPQAPSAGRRRAYYRNRDHFATIRTASLVSSLIKDSCSLVLSTQKQSKHLTLSLYIEQMMSLVPGWW